MLLRDGIISLNNPHRVYKPGDIVSGTLKFELHHVRYVNCLSVELRGEARTAFPIGIIYCTGQQTYIKHKIDLISKHSPEEKKRLGPGVYMYWFSIKLPENIPGSMSGDWGKITYTLEFCVDKPWSLLHKKCLGITVRNTMAQEEPSNLSASVQFLHNFWFRGGQILGYIKLTSTRHMVGSQIPIIIQIDNYSREQLVRILSKLVRRTTFIVSRPIGTLRHDNMILNSNAENYEVQAGQHTEYNIHLQIPPNYFFPNIRTCGIIKITHFIEIMIRIQGCQTNIRKKIFVQLYHV